jgi:Phosphotransferase enzyme family
MGNPSMCDGIVRSDPRFCRDSKGVGRFGRAPPVAPPRLCIDNLVWCPGCTAWRVRQRSGEKGQATMEASEVPRAVAAAMSTASALDLAVDDAIVLHDSNRLTLRLLPCDVLARVAPVAHQVAQFEVELAQRLVATGCPVAALDPRVEQRVYERDGFVVTLWAYYEPATPREVSPAEYANALERLHAGMRKLDFPTQHFTDRVERAQQLVASRDHTPALADADRELLGDTLRSLRRVIGERGGAEQLLHGEPHPGNLLTTHNGLLFVDLETCCRGPVEFDLAHAPEEVSEHYPGVNQDLLRQCRILVLAMITTWRWDRGDQLPNGRQLGAQWLSQIRAERYA